MPCERRLSPRPLLALGSPSVNSGVTPVFHSMAQPDHTVRDSNRQPSDVGASPLIGRTSEIRRLMGVMGSAVRTRDLRVALITGVAGVGKRDWRRKSSSAHDRPAPEWGRVGPGRTPPRRRCGLGTPFFATLERPRIYRSLASARRRAIDTRVSPVCSSICGPRPDRRSGRHRHRRRRSSRRGHAAADFLRHAGAARAAAGPAADSPR